MRVPKYKDTVRLTLFGRYDKLLNDTTSIYTGYDKALTTQVGGGINSADISNNGTVGFMSAPNVYFSNANNFIAGSTTLSTTSVGAIASVTINAGGVGFTSGPTLFFFGNGTTQATATATQTAGAITAVTITNVGAGYTSVPGIAWNGGGAMVIAANLTTGNLSSFTITTSPFFTTAPTILISGGGGATQTTTCTLNNGYINTIALPAANLAYTTAPTIYILGGAGTGALLLTPVMYTKVNTLALTTKPSGTFITQPTISFNGGGVIDITATMNGGNTIVTEFTITNGGYTGCFATTPTILLSGGGGYATTTCTLTNGVITAITLPVTGSANIFTSTPTVSVLSGGIPTGTAILNPYTIVIGGQSPYQNIKRLRFDLNQEFSQLQLADGAHLYLEYVRMPALGANSTCFKNLRLIGGENINIFDSVQGSQGNPILFSCEGGNNANNYYISENECFRLPVPPNFLSKGYIEFEIDTVATANITFTAAQLNDLIIKITIEEPKNEQTQDNNLAPEYGSAKTFYVQRNINHRI